MDICNAAYEGKLEDLKQFLDSDPTSINYKDEDQRTPLHWSCDIDSVVLLLDHKANPNSNNDLNQTPLHYAASKGYSEICQKLLQKGASVNEPNSLGQTPIFKAASRGHYGIVQLLIDSGASVSISDKIGNTPLHLACEEAYGDLSILLINNGANPEKKNSENNTPLQLCTDKKALTYISEYISQNQL
ncbi:26S proteasome non-ATPase regulatory subunit 10 [Smittium culicis]|uniref:26S proteasome non-ATPase regulatory subunit 10 n=1 Tax=Smittium culicis TaxID=133412 RepID=A0A1R1XL10_9FUNG|nr:26S proteasome non-ATPase regulatory subunit 10 [Smittium culicis]